MAQSLEGIDVLVFTGHRRQRRQGPRADLPAAARLGLDLDPDANENGADVVNQPSSSAEIRVIATSEETTMARQVRAVVC